MGICVNCEGTGYYHNNKTLNGRYTFSNLYCDCKTGKGLQEMSRLTNGVADHSNDAQKG